MPGAGHKSKWSQVPAQLVFHRLQTTASLVRRSEAGHLHPLGRVLRSQCHDRRMVLVVLEGAAKPEGRTVHAAKLPTRLYLWRLRQRLHCGVLQRSPVGDAVRGIRRKVSEDTGPCGCVLLVSVTSGDRCYFTFPRPRDVSFLLNISDSEKCMECVCVCVCLYVCVCV